MNGELAELKKESRRLKAELKRRGVDVSKTTVVHRWRIGPIRYRLLQKEFGADFFVEFNEGNGWEGRSAVKSIQFWVVAMAVASLVEQRRRKR